MPMVHYQRRFMILNVEYDSFILPTNTALQHIMQIILFLMPVNSMQQLTVVKNCHVQTFCMQM